MAEDVFWERYSNRFRTLSPLDSGPLQTGVNMAICIPVFAEPALLITLNSLNQCDTQNLKAEVMLLFNKNEFITKEELEIHERSIADAANWIDEHPHKDIHWNSIVIEDLPDPKGGVGWARKLCMDEAARRLDADGIIVCLDADCTVQANYLLEIKNQFSLHPNKTAASVYFEHSCGGLGDEEKISIIDYELHLRYLIDVQRWCGHPHAYQTVGSSMAVRRNAYLAQGGMNTKRAGEDFYFLHKFTATSDVFDITTTEVYPSARISTRVPFGTGKAMQTMKNSKERWLTTNIQSFREIKVLFESLEAIWLTSKSRNKDIQKHLGNLSEGLREFLKQIKIETTVREIASHTSTYASFKKRFFRYFNAFQMIRYTHYMRDRHHEDMLVETAIRQLMAELNINSDQFLTAEDLLREMRKLDKESSI